jgi:hypothetical protein
MAENEKLWHEERGTPDAIKPSGTDMRNVGITPGGITGDLENIGDLAADAQAGGEVPGVEPGISQGGAPGAPGGAPAPTAPGGSEPSLAV